MSYGMRRCAIAFLILSNLPLAHGVPPASPPFWKSCLSVSAQTVCTVGLGTFLTAIPLFLLDYTALQETPFESRTNILIASAGLIAGTISLGASLGKVFSKNMKEDGSLHADHSRYADYGNRGGVLAGSVLTSALLSGAVLYNAEWYAKALIHAPALWTPVNILYSSLNTPKENTILYTVYSLYTPKSIQEAITLCFCSYVPFWGFSKEVTEFLINNFAILGPLLLLQSLWKAWAPEDAEDNSISPPSLERENAEEIRLAERARVNPLEDSL